MTGASTGIGAATARELAQRGFHVLAGVRRDAYADAIRSANVEPSRLDITNEAEIAMLVKRIADDPARHRHLAPDRGHVDNPRTRYTIGREMVSDPGVFMQSNNCPANLAAGSFCTISVTFTPSAATKRTGTLTITDNANGGMQSVSLNGTGK